MRLHQHADLITPSTERESSFNQRMGKQSTFNRSRHSLFTIRHDDDVVDTPNPG
jgi:hypothetical protein